MQLVGRLVQFDRQSSTSWSVFATFITFAFFDSMLTLTDLHETFFPFGAARPSSLLTSFFLSFSVFRQDLTTRLDLEGAVSIWNTELKKQSNTHVLFDHAT